MDSEPLSGMTKLIIKGSFMKMKSTEKESTAGPTEGPTMENGLKGNFTAEEFINGPMGRSMKESTRWIKNMEREFSFGPMGGNTTGIGKMASSMELGITLGKTANRGRADGNLEK